MLLQHMSFCGARILYLVLMRLNVSSLSGCDSRRLQLEAVACAAVLPFAKRGDDRSNNLKRLQQLFPRIVAGQYQAPRRASDACKDLMKRLLTPDPTHRISVAQIMCHPW